MQIAALFSEKKRVGKTTTANGVVEDLRERGYIAHRISYADNLKQDCAMALFNSPSDRNWVRLIDRSDLKDHPTHQLAIHMVHDTAYRNFLVGMYGNAVTLPRSWRWHLEHYGTHYRRKHLNHDTVWIEALSSRLIQLEDSGAQFVVIDDLRTLKEATHLANLRRVTFFEIVSPTLGVEDTLSYAADIKEYVSYIQYLNEQDEANPDFIATKLVIKALPPEVHHAKVHCNR